MKNIQIGLITALLTLTHIAAASSQTFDFTTSEFRERLDRQLGEDGGDQTSGCRKVSTTDVKCAFKDAQFQKQVAKLKEINLVNGRFSLKSEMLLTHNPAGKVTSVIYGGTRSDPPNLFHFIGQVGAVLAAIKPDIQRPEVTRIITELKLMRGDSDPSIGEPQTVIESFAAITCNNQRSSIGCRFEPRF